MLCFFSVGCSAAPKEYQGLSDASALAKYKGTILNYDQIKLGDDGLIYRADEGSLYTGRIINKQPGKPATLVYDVTGGKRNGLFNIYYPATGKIHTAMFYKENKITSETGYFDDGKSIQYDYKINDNRGSVMQYYDKDKHKDVMTEFRFGDSDDPDGTILRDGKQVQYYVPEGKVRTEIDYKNDLADGAIKSYYPNGKPKITARATTGYLDGPVNVYYSNGQLKESIEYVTGLVEENTEGYFLSGNYKHYATDGKLLEEKTLDNFPVAPTVKPGNTTPAATTPTTVAQQPTNTAQTPSGAHSSAPAQPSTTPAQPADPAQSGKDSKDDDDKSDNQTATILAGTALVLAVGDFFYDDDYYWGFAYPYPYPYPYPPPPPPPGPPGPGPHPPGPPGPGPHPGPPGPGPHPGPPGPGPHPGPPGPGPHPGPPGPHPGPGPKPTPPPPHPGTRPGEGGSGTYNPPDRPPAPGHPGADNGGRQPARPGSQGGGVQRQPVKPGGDSGSVRREPQRPSDNRIERHNSPAARGGLGHGGFGRAGGFHRPIGRR